ncbi:FAD-binding oxidoreductase [Cyclobacterium sp.]|uniref:FAD-binding oxidoreductase n=1 Tax=Cyclobacterium sp. TaxID=1966343 RepID=UPI001990E2E0|nr:FAD-binding oxidoreductase [Cyclobacterium sp.]MBD3627470.1 FAD-binding oxidoreductase [Cyclobacterium sp.]
MANQTIISQHPIPTKTWGKLKNALTGELLLPDSKGYDESRIIWNGMIDRKPACIIQCADVDDVVAAVNFGRKHEMLVAVKGGGHNAAGFAICDEGMVIDLSKMKGIEVDPTTQTAIAQPGVLWGEFDAATQEHGLAVTGGAVSTTGIAGLTLGGGVGWLMGKFGATCDNLLSAQLVTADGEVLQANPEENPDLFWAICGGGGNFGIVTCFKFQLHKLGPIIGGMVLHPMDKIEEMLKFFRSFTENAPDELTTYAFTMTSPDGMPMAGMALCYCGHDLEEGEKIIAPLRAFGPPLADMICPMPYLQQQSMLDATVPHGQFSYWKANQLDSLSDEAISTFKKQIPSVTSPRTMVLIEHHHGAINKVSPDATAFRQRKSPYDFIIISLWNQPDESDKHIKWTRNFFAAMKPFFSSGVYVNALHNDEGNDRVRAAYGDNYEKLRHIKQKYDPDNFFRWNNNIVP